jgi:hypothetical protein
MTGESQELSISGPGCVVVLDDQNLRHERLSTSNPGGGIETNRWLMIGRLAEGDHTEVAYTFRFSAICTVSLFPYCVIVRKTE